MDWEVLHGLGRDILDVVILYVRANLERNGGWGSQCNEQGGGVKFHIVWFEVGGDEGCDGLFVRKGSDILIIMM